MLIRKSRSSDGQGYGQSALEKIREAFPYVSFNTKGMDVGLYGFPDDISLEWEQQAAESKLQVYSVNNRQQGPFFRKKKNVLDVVIAFVAADALAGIATTILQCRKIFPDTPVVVLSTGCDVKSVKSAVTAGALGFLLDQDKFSKKENLLIRLVKKEEPAISDAVVPSLFWALRGQGVIENAHVRLSQLQLQIATLLVQGLSYEDISSSVNKNINAVRYHIKQIYQKFNIHNKMQLLPLLESYGVVI